MTSEVDSYSNVSHLYMMQLTDKIENVLQNMFSEPKEKNIERYIRKWHEEDGEGFSNWENFTIHTDTTGKLNLSDTLYGMPNSTLIRIAIELGIETPGFLPSIPVFKNVLLEQNENAYSNFESALKHVFDAPEESVALASSTLEGIIKTIIEDTSFFDGLSKMRNASLSKLVKEAIKELGLQSGFEAPIELSTIASQLCGIASSIDNLRSDKSAAHGKTGNDYVVDNPLWAQLTINATTTVGLFLWNYHRDAKQKSGTMLPLSDKKSDDEVLF